MSNGSSALQRLDKDHSNPIISVVLFFFFFFFFFIRWFPKEKAISHSFLHTPSTAIPTAMVCLCCESSPNKSREVNASIFPPCTLGTATTPVLDLMSPCQPLVNSINRLDDADARHDVTKMSI